MWEACSEPLSITQDGEHALEARATDGASNSASAGTLVKLNIKLPELEVNAVAERSGQLRFEVTDVKSALGAIGYRLDAQQQWSTLDTETATRARCWVRSRSARRLPWLSYAPATWQATHRTGLGTDSCHTG